MLELAILGSLKEQPLHGYELKKRVGETLGSVWAISFGSLYPALRRLERDGAIEVVDPAQLPPIAGSIHSTGSLDGDLAAARLRRGGKPSRRPRKAYRLTPAGDARLAALLVDPDLPGDDRTFALQLAFCVYLDRDGRLQLLERRRARLTDEIARARQTSPRHGDRYRRSLAEHHLQSVERDLEWVDQLIAAERGDQPFETQGAAAS